MGIFDIFDIFQKFFQFPLYMYMEGNLWTEFFLPFLPCHRRKSFMDSIVIVLTVILLMILSVRENKKK